MFVDERFDSKGTHVNYYSQYGEDRWMAENLPLPRCGVFIDVGAADGRDGSNTLGFEEMGWTGLLIEPDPRQAPSLRQNRGAIVETCAAGREDLDRVSFPLMANPQLSGFRRQGPTAIVPQRTLDTIIQRHGIKRIDLLSIDTEGTELDVWAGLTTIRPQVVVAEWMTVGLPNESGKLLAAFGAAGYSLVHVTTANLIFVQRG